MSGFIPPNPPARPPSSRIPPPISIVDEQGRPYQPGRIQSEHRYAMATAVLVGAIAGFLLAAAGVLN